MLRLALCVLQLFIAAQILCRADDKATRSEPDRMSRRGFRLTLCHAHERVVLVQTVDDGAESGHILEVIEGILRDFFSRD